MSDIKVKSRDPCFGFFQTNFCLFGDDTLFKRGYKILSCFQSVLPLCFKAFDNRVVSACSFVHFAKRFGNVSNNAQSPRRIYNYIFKPLLIHRLQFVPVLFAPFCKARIVNSSEPAYATLFKESPIFPFGATDYRLFLYLVGDFFVIRFTAARNCDKISPRTEVGYEHRKQ